MGNEFNKQFLGTGRGLAQETASTPNIVQPQQIVHYSIPLALIEENEFEIVIKNFKT